PVRLDPARLDLDDGVALVGDDGEQVGRLPNDREVAPQTLAHREASTRLPLLFVHRGCEGQAAGDAGVTTNERLDRHHHGSATTLHVCRTASVEPPLDDLTSVRVMRPAPAHWDGVRMAVEDQMRACPFGSEPSQKIGPPRLDLLDLACHAVPA